MPAADLARVIPLRREDPDEDAAILAAAAGGDRERAAAMLFDRHGEVVRRVIHRILGPSDDVEDARQEAMLRTLDRLDRVESGGELRSFACGVAAFVAREQLRKRARRRWLRFFAPEEMPEPEQEGARDREAVAAVYRVLDELDADDRVAFCLRVIEGMELEEVASACGVSLATAKRRIAHARERFMVHAEKQPELAGWVGESGGAS